MSANFTNLKNIFVTNSVLNCQQNPTLEDTKKQNMKEVNTNVGNVNTRQLQNPALEETMKEYMKDKNTNVGNVNTSKLQGVISLNTNKYKCIECDHKAASNANLNQHQQVVHEGIKHPCKECNYQATA